jgi:hypothetical protein
MINDAGFVRLIKAIVKMAAKYADRLVKQLIAVMLLMLRIRLAASG